MDWRVALGDGSPELLLFQHGRAPGQEICIALRHHCSIWIKRENDRDTQTVQPLPSAESVLLIFCCCCCDAFLNGEESKAWQRASAAKIDRLRDVWMLLFIPSVSVCFSSAGNRWERNVRGRREGESTSERHYTPGRRKRWAGLTDWRVVLQMTALRWWING